MAHLSALQWSAAELVHMSGDLGLSLNFSGAQFPHVYNEYIITHAWSLGAVCRFLPNDQRRQGPRDCRALANRLLRTGVLSPISL